jgi:putative hydrolase of the HAD superfamily
MVLPKISALFWDVGGVLLSNAWDHEQRQQTLKQFGLNDEDEAEFESRHEMLVSSFERGKISLQDYLERTIFYRPRPFTIEAFTQHMLSLSQPYPDTLRLAKELARSGKYLMSTLNNESKELNLFRIQAPASWDCASPKKESTAWLLRLRSGLRRSVASSTIVR